MIAVVAGRGEAFADLKTNSQLAVTQSDVAGTKWTVWSRSTTGRLLARRESATGGNQWFDYGLPFGVQCSSRGVTATSYVNGGHIYERAYCASSAAGGSIYELPVNDGVAQPWRNLNLGVFGTKAELAATSIISGGHWTLFVFFTAGADDLFVWWQDVTVPGLGNVSQLAAVNAYSTTSQLAVSRAPGSSPGYLHLFAARGVGTVDVWRRDSNGFSGSTTLFGRAARTTSRT